MLSQRIESALSVVYESKLLIFDKSGFSDVYDYHRLLQNHGFYIFHYAGVEETRLIYERNIRYADSKCAIIVTTDAFVPYDIKKALYPVELSYEKLFPNLDANTLDKHRNDLELISIAYDGLYTPINTQRQTEVFIQERIMTSETIAQFGAHEVIELKTVCANASNYLDWIAIAKRVARLNYYKVAAGCVFDIAFVDEAFKRFILTDYGKLSGEVHTDFPPILPKALNIITKNGTQKVALIVMDGMSLFDFEVLSRHTPDFKYEYNASFALIPTTTSISRQSLLSSKYPQQLANPFSLVEEEKGFLKAGISLGYATNEIQYQRGYDVDVGVLTRLACIIINEVDDIVHGQQHGRAGMLDGMKVLSESGKLKSMICKFHSQGFTVYIVADHGNTPCVGIGRFRSGVEVETKSKRMVALKDFAEESDFLRENTNLFPGTYLDKSYRYYICKSGVSFDNKGDEVITHGGMSIDEVVVPFIKVLEV